MFDGDRQARYALADFVVPRERTARKDRPAVGMLLLPRQRAAAVGHVAVASAIERRDDGFSRVELFELVAERLRGRRGDLP